jgi:hypothetical protein
MKKVTAYYTNHQAGRVSNGEYFLKLMKLYKRVELKHQNIEQQLRDLDVKARGLNEKRARLNEKRKEVSSLYVFLMNMLENHEHAWSKK